MSYDRQKIINAARDYCAANFKLEEVFERAAQYLEERWEHDAWQRHFSCAAVEAAIKEIAYKHPTYSVLIADDQKLFWALGDVTNSVIDSVRPGLSKTQTLFDDIPERKAQFAARILWLTFLAELARTGELTWYGMKK